jgi:hypothetical protein
MLQNTRRSLCGFVAAAGLLTAACGPTGVYRPYFDEGGSGASINEFTYVSLPHQPKSVSVIDTRTQEVIFSMDIPVGQQLVMNFDDKKEAEAKDRYMPATMRWALMPAGNRYGSLSNRLSVPAASSRLVEWDIRPGPEVSAPPQVETMVPPPLPDEPVRN